MTIHGPSVPNWDPDVLAAAREVDAKFPRNDWTSTYPYHGEGSATGAYAVDYMVSNLTIGKQIAEYLWLHRKRLGIRYVIWNRKIISETNALYPNVWITYTRGATSTDPSVAHTNHAHASHYANNTWIYKALVPIINVRVTALNFIKVIGWNKGYATHVRACQIALRDVGYDPGPIDRLKGPRTVGAMNQWLAANGWPDASGNYVTLTQLSRLISQAEAKVPGDHYPPVAHD